jgi:pimeloyl-ACP methyl ester carboxylesterase
MPTICVNGARLNFLQLEPSHGGPAEDLVMVHGLATNLAFWYMQYAAPLSERFRITLFDLRGHGNSEITHSGYSPDGLASDMEELLKELRIPKAHFIAHSFGGAVSLALAKKQPQLFQSLVLADTQISSSRSILSYKTWHNGATVAQLLLRCGVELDPQDPFFGYHLLTAVSELVASGQTLPTELTQLVGPMLGKYGKRTAKKWLSLVGETDAPRQLVEDDGLTREVLSSFKFPVLALYGERSQAFVTSEGHRGALPQVDFRVIKDAGHFFPATRPGEVLSLCEQFWGPGFPQQVSAATLATLKDPRST